MATSDILQTMADSITAAYDSLNNLSIASPEHKNLQNISTTIDNITKYSGGFHEVGTWTATVSNLGAEDPSAVKIYKTSDFPTVYDTVIQQNIEFIKIPKMYRKINSVVDEQITSYTISNKKLDDQWLVYPCFLDESGNELDYILLAKEYGSEESTIENARIDTQQLGVGYQLMDWMILRLWQDLMLVLHGSVKVDYPGGTIVDKLGLSWAAYKQSIDGVWYSSGNYFLSDKPSKYVNSPTVDTDGYFTVAYTIGSDTHQYNIKKLGYDSNHPFVNLPSEDTSASTFETFYCSGKRLASSRPVCTFGPQYGIFSFEITIAIGSRIRYRICYRPIS